ncbi:hypothetical protein AMECASPLE_037808 [Ameca splendens]|uniref:Uncharacterized protein n=1 Tax=Ameca splendens TaxID=208324 RepID=A0ABV0YV33_9TELE
MIFSFQFIYIYIAQIHNICHLKALYKVNSIVLDHLFAEYWTICTLLDATRPPGVFGYFVSRTVCAYRSRRPLRLIRQGRRSPEDTVNYITEDETTHHLLFSWRSRHNHQHLKHHLEKWISSILPRWPTNNS